MCVQHTWESFEPFEPSLRSATVQAWFKGSNGGLMVRNISERPSLYCPKRHTYTGQIIRRQNLIIF